MRPVNLALQVFVVAATGGLVALVATGASERPQSLAPSPAGPTHGATRSVDALDSAESPGVRATRHRLQLVDRDTGEALADTPIQRLPTSAYPSLSHAGTSDAAGIVELAVVGDGLHAFAVFEAGRASRPIVLGHDSTVQARPEVLHVARAATLRGEVHVAEVTPRRALSYDLAVSLPILLGRGVPSAPDAPEPPRFVLRAPVRADLGFELTNIPAEVDGLVVWVESSGSKRQVARTALRAFAPGEERTIDLDTLDEFGFDDEPQDGESDGESDVAVELQQGHGLLIGEYRSSRGVPLVHVALAVLPGTIATEEYWVAHGPLPAGVTTTRTDKDGRFAFWEIGDPVVYVGRKFAPTEGVHVFQRWVIDGPRSVVEEPPPQWVSGQVLAGEPGLDGELWFKVRAPYGTRGVLLPGGGPFRLGPFLPERFGGPLTFEARPVERAAGSFEVALRTAPGQLEDLVAVVRRRAE